MNSSGTATDRLADVIQVLQIACKTGLLIVMRDDRENLSEQGTITFQKGQIIAASVGSFRADKAFSLLTMWRGCHFVFETASSEVPIINGIAKGYEYPEKALSTRMSVRDVPRRIQMIHEVLPHFADLGLSRTHRHLFLLIDGKRREQELMYLMRLRFNEVDKMLTDLESIGFIRR